MSGYRHRFRDFSREEVARWVAELGAHASLAGRRLLSALEVEDLLGLLPPNYFRLLKKRRLWEMMRSVKEFEEKIQDIEGAAERLAGECRETLPGNDEAAAERWLQAMEKLQLGHPAVWYRVYCLIKKEDRELALQLEPEGMDRPFLLP